jgi:hypothetical protein
MITHQQVGCVIDGHSMLNVTADTLRYLRNRYTDAFIVECLPYCSKGNRLALESLLTKAISAKYGIEDKENINEEHRDD